MNTNSKRLGLYIAIMLVLTTVATALRSAACILHLDYASGFFDDKTLISIANAIITFTVIGAFSYMFSAARIKLRASFATSATYVPTGVLGVATAFLGAKILSHVASTSRYPLLSAETFSLKTPATLVGILAGILAFLSIAHHFLNAFITEGKAEIRAYFASATVTFLALYSMLIYLDTSLSIGDPAKLLRLTAFLLSALFFLYEARISLGREMWRIYTAFGLSAAALCAYTSIPAIITYFAKDILISSLSKRSLASIEEYLLLLAIFIFIVARLCVTATLREEKENAYINVLSTYAKEREGKVRESYKRFQKIFASKQLSIFDLYGGEIPAEPDEDEEFEVEIIEEEENKEPTISDEVIYESIFGEMPEHETEEDESSTPEDMRVPEEIAEQLLRSLEYATNDDQKET
jgi:hypothetical protein